MELVEDALTKADRQTDGQPLRGSGLFCFACFFVCLWFFGDGVFLVSSFGVFGKAGGGDLVPRKLHTYEVCMLVGLVEGGNWHYRENASASNATQVPRAMTGRAAWPSLRLGERVVLYSSCTQRWEY